MKIPSNISFTQIENTIIRDESLTVYQKMVYIVLASFTDSNNVCYPSYEKIAKSVGCSRKKAITTVDELVSMGLIIVTKEHGKANKYKILCKGAENKNASNIRSNSESKHTLTGATYL